jgi:hypothetical protein
VPRRLAAAAATFVVLVAAYEALTWLFGLPRPVGPILAFVVAGLVLADPADLIWPATASRAAIRARRPRASAELRRLALGRARDQPRSVV